MLLIDGVKYELWTPGTEDEFEWVVGKHAEDIYGKDAKYFDLKHKLASRSGTGSIPDGYAITLGNKPEVHIIELELASHSLQHIVAQIVNIINGMDNPATQQKICNAIEDGINEDEIFGAKITKAIKPVAIHRFLADSFLDKLSIIDIIIDKSSPVLEEAISKITPKPRIVEFQTFERVGVGLAVRAHLFEPAFQAPTEIITTIKPEREIVPTRKVAGRVTVENLIDANILKVGQVIYGWHEGKRYEGKLLNKGKILVAHSGQTFDSLSGAASHVRGYAVDGWTWRYTARENGKECKLDELRNEYKSNLSL